jgi:hypothetical protein
MMDYAVDAGWADQLVRALIEIAKGRPQPEVIARSALERAGIWDHQVDLWEG